MGAANIAQTKKPANDARITPMFSQFLAAKEANPGCLIFFRMGDFYELFFEDAELAADILDIALTKRGTHLGKEVPMCGVPVRAYTEYMNKLTRAGHQVAIFEQMESPEEAKKRSGKTLVKREVVEIVTSATVTDDRLLQPRAHNYLAAYNEIRGEAALSWADLSTGDFYVGKLLPENRGSWIARVAASEILLPEQLVDDEKLAQIVAESGSQARALGAASFASNSAQARLKKLYQVQELAGFADFSRVELSVLGAVADYIALTKRASVPVLKPPKQEKSGDNMLIDAATRRNLELVQSLGGSRKGSLLQIVDDAQTAAGGRLLEARLSAPSLDIATINERLDAVDYFVEDSDIREKVRASLRAIPDLERALSRLAVDKGTPRDLAVIGSTICGARLIKKQIQERRHLRYMPKELVATTNDLPEIEELADHLQRALVAEPPPVLRDGNYIAQGYDSALDEMRNLRDNGRQKIADLEARYRRETSINSLKIKHNSFLGYFIEVPEKAADKLLHETHADKFIYRTKLKNSVRFTSVELTELQNHITHASENVLQIERRHFDALRQECLAQKVQLAELSRAIARVDVAQSFAQIAATRNWCRPNVVEEADLHIVDGRHPVVEQALQKEAKEFIANDICLGNTADSKERICLITGPNMAGKSTFLRQNALIALLAHIGAPVPASSATVGLVDKLFSRVGASDDLARGRSTFMVEMVETAAILNQATERSLVILDEIGRGTATWDGLSIAWACLEHIHQSNRCRTLFATHYHELNALAERLSAISVASLQVKEWKGNLVFLYSVAAGSADRSYGVQVAKLAGLPASVVERARVMLQEFERFDRDVGKERIMIVDELPLFSAGYSREHNEAAPLADEQQKLVAELEKINPDILSPREALEALYNLKQMKGGKGEE